MIEFILSWVIIGFLVFILTYFLVTVVINCQSHDMPWYELLGELVFLVIVWPIVLFVLLEELKDDAFRSRVRMLKHG